MLKLTEETTINDLCSGDGFIADGDWVESKDQDKAGNVRLIQLADIGIGMFLNKSNRKMNTETANRLRCNYLEAGDILVARMPDPIGRACIFPGSADKCVTVVDVCIIRPDPGRADARYVMHAINSSHFSKKIGTFVKGTTRQRISRKALSALSIPLPPLEEQRRIAAILDLVDELLQKRRKSIKLLDRLAQSVFVNMFGDPTLIANGGACNWKTAKISDYCTMGSGTTPLTSKRADYYDGDIPWIKSGELRENTILTSGETVTAQALAQTALRLVPEGSVLVAMYGATIGRAAILGIAATTNQAVCHLIPDHDTIQTKYLFYCIRSLAQYFINLGSGGAQPNINQKIISNTIIPIPHSDVQKAFESKIAMIEDLVQKNKDHYQRLDQLSHSLQSVYFGQGHNMPADLDICQSRTADSTMEMAGPHE